MGVFIRSSVRRYRWLEMNRRNLRFPVSCAFLAIGAENGLAGAVITGSGIQCSWMDSHRLRLRIADYRAGGINGATDRKNRLPRKLARFECDDPWRLWLALTTPETARNI